MRYEKGIVSEPSGLHLERVDVLGRMLQAQQRLVRVQAERVLEGRRDRAEHRDVGARAKELLTFTSQDDDLDVLVHARAQDGLRLSLRRSRWRQKKGRFPP